MFLMPVITIRISATAQRRPLPEPKVREIWSMDLQYPIAGSDSNLLDNAASDDRPMAHVAVLDSAGEGTTPVRKPGDDLAPGCEAPGKRVQKKDDLRHCYVLQHVEGHDEII